MKKIIYTLVFLMVLAITTLFLLPSYLSVASVKEPLEIVIPKGASTTYVANLLSEKKVVKSELWFKYKAKQAQVDRFIKPGTYVLTPDVTMDEIFQLLIKGAPETPVVLTIPEGFTIYQMAERMESIGLGTADEFLQATNTYFSDKGYSFDTEKLYFSLEGYLYPDTYHFTMNNTPADVVNRLAKTMEDIFTAEYQERAKELNLSIHEVLTIASLIEREAYNDEEKSIISGVIYNRIKKKMPLQIDATVIYGIGEGKEHITRVLNVHLEESSPFNTYRNPGLPPGPIAAPSKTSIYAALYPEDHNYLYYVLGKDGHVFGTTYKEHLKNVQDYRKIMKEKSNN
ncbi:endolytic transglycosylase MltG [Alkaliphilus hydrothermalis]|uniref:Endolytic murein transglycosylase n=1 Tax=Alkaliphilus hydrothermalis TaxID=1482730 RepID=A0ABS2NP45_9FIRM|nr:endolytic transglycosylase MltG [Alkaliphilus hydrothermalis]MBM7614707.1 UPF0755 protein [Alkaliphilus hydrothermalis]